MNFLMIIHKQTLRPLGFLGPMEATDNTNFCIKVDGEYLKLEPVRAEFHLVDELESVAEQVIADEKGWGINAS